MPMTHAPETGARKPASISGAGFFYASCSESKISDARENMDDENDVVAAAMCFVAANINKKGTEKNAVATATDNNKL